MEGEAGNRLPFMDVLVERVGNAFERPVYCKPTFTGLYTRWDSFTATSHKINLVKSLTSRAKRICTPARLEAEIVCLKGLFADNGYSSGLVSRLVQQMLETASLHFVLVSIMVRFWCQSRFTQDEHIRYV